MFLYLLKWFQHDRVLKLMPVSYFSIMVKDLTCRPSAGEVLKHAYIEKQMEVSGTHIMNRLWAHNSNQEKNHHALILIVMIQSGHKICTWCDSRAVMIYPQISNISRTLVGNKICWSLRCRRCSNYIFILDLTHGPNRLGKVNSKTRPEIFKFRDLVWLMLEVWRYVQNYIDLIRSLFYI